MLTALFILSALVLAASVVRRPRTRWQRVAVWLAGILMLAVIVAWGIEYVMQNAHAAERVL
ncbi:MAG: hypothetical protein ABL996_18280 [Micropepsaceae bacterium]